MSTNLLEKHAKSFYWASFSYLEKYLENVLLYIIFVELWMILLMMKIH